MRMTAIDQRIWSTLHGTNWKQEFVSIKLWSTITQADNAIEAAKAMRRFDLTEMKTNKVCI